MTLGSVKTVVAGRGFGFIIPEEHGPDIFFHARDMAPGLEFSEQLTGMRVTYEVTDTERGPRASNVKAAI